MENFSISKLIKNKEPKPRLLSEMRQVLRAEEKNDKTIYDVYREIYLTDGIRYDLTFLYPDKFENELTKTFGHYHEGDMMEIMEVIKGKAMWLIQKYNNDPSIIEEAYIIEANEGEKAIFPPDFGAISINPENNKDAILSNWVSLNTISDYKPYEELHGACYYALKNKSGEIIFEKNKHYQRVPELIKLKPKELPEYGIVFNKPLLSLKETPEKLEFLNKPEKYKNLLTIENCYTKI